MGNFHFLAEVEVPGRAGGFFASDTVAMLLFFAVGCVFFTYFCGRTVICPPWMLFLFYFRYSALVSRFPPSLVYPMVPPLSVFFFMRCRFAGVPLIVAFGKL